MFFVVVELQTKSFITACFKPMLYVLLLNAWQQRCYWILFDYIHWHHSTHSQPITDTILDNSDGFIDNLHNMYFGRSL